MRGSKYRRRRTVVRPRETHWFSRQVTPVALLVAAIVIAYIPLFSNSFIDYDDPVYITGNPYVGSGLTLRMLAWAWKPDASSGNWHPVTWIFHALDVTLFGLNPAGHHATSLFIHCLNAILIFVLLSRVTIDKWRAWVAAAVFGLHPLSVESVSWASEKKNVLCTLFFLLAIAAYGWYAQRPGIRRYLFVVIAFGLSLAAKPMVITLPFVLLLLDFWPIARVKSYSLGEPLGGIEQRNIGQLIVEKLPLLAMSAGSAVVTLKAQSMAGAVASIHGLPLISRIGNAIYSYLAYVVSIFWPLDLVPFYPHIPLEPWRIAIASLFIVSVSVVVWWQRTARPYLIVCWLFYLGTFVPVIGIVQVGSQARADRFTYIPIIGVAVAIVWLTSEAMTRWNCNVRVRVAAVTALLVVLTVLTQRQVRFWHDDISLWSRNLEVTKDNVVAEDNLGISLLQQGRTAEAMSHFYRATRLDPSDPISAANVATDFLSRGMLREAIAKYEAALTQPQTASVPTLLENIHSNLGAAFLQLGEIEQARNEFETALRLNPDDHLAQRGIVRINKQLGQGALP